MTPAFRLTSGHNPCSVIPCKTAHPQSLRISRPRSHLSSPSYPLPRLISSAPCCAAADLCQSMPTAVPNAPCPSCPVQCPHLAHLPSATRSAAALIRAMPSRPALPLSASQLFNALSPHYSAPQGPCTAPRHTVSLRITHCRIKHTRALLYICFPGLNKALPSPRVPRHLSAPAALRFASPSISLLPPRLSSDNHAIIASAKQLRAQHCHRYPHQSDTRPRASAAPLTSALAVVANPSNAISLLFKSVQCHCISNRRRPVRPQLIAIPSFAPASHLFSMQSPYVASYR